MKGTKAYQIAAPALQIDKILDYLLDPDPLQNLINAFSTDHRMAKLGL